MLGQYPGVTGSAGIPGLQTCRCKPRDRAFKNAQAFPRVPAFTQDPQRSLGLLQRQELRKNPRLEPRRSLGGSL